jgi:hypothetical protein
MRDLILKTAPAEVKEIALAVLDGQRLSPEEALSLYSRADLSLMALLASSVKRMKSGDAVFFNRNFHIEPTNICLYNCRFCSYHKPEGDPESWELTENEILDIVRHFDGASLSLRYISPEECIPRVTSTITAGCLLPSGSKARHQHQGLLSRGARIYDTQGGMSWSDGISLLA